MASVLRQRTIDYSDGLTREKQQYKHHYRDELMNISSNLFRTREGRIVQKNVRREHRPREAAQAAGVRGVPEVERGETHGARAAFCQLLLSITVAMRSLVAFL